MMSDSIVLLGSTGSIGVNTLQIASRYSIQIEALVAGNNIYLLNEQIEKYKPKYVAIADAANKESVNHPHVFCGDEGILPTVPFLTNMRPVHALDLGRPLNPWFGSACPLPQPGCVLGKTEFRGAPPSSGDASLGGHGSRVPAHVGRSPVEENSAY